MRKRMLTAIVVAPLFLTGCVGTMVSGMATGLTNPVVLGQQAWTAAKGAAAWKKVKDNDSLAAPPVRPKAK